MKIEVLRVLSCLCLTGTSGEQEREATMHHTNKANPQQQLTDTAFYY
jgi:hypothetical protein